MPSPYISRRRKLKHNTLPYYFRNQQKSNSKYAPKAVVLMISSGSGLEERIAVSSVSDSRLAKVVCSFSDRHDDWILAKGENNRRGGQYLLWMVTYINGDKSPSSEYNLRIRTTDMRVALGAMRDNIPAYYRQRKIIDGKTADMLHSKISWALKAEISGQAKPY